MGIKTKTQWQKVWMDKKYLSKKAAAAARRSAFGTGGGPSTAPQLTQWELKVISIIGDGFGEPQTPARVPAFDEVFPEASTAASTQPMLGGNLPQLHDNLPAAESIEPDVSLFQRPCQGPVVHNQISRSYTNNKISAIYVSN